MAWRIVVQPNGKFARFSDIVDNFTHSDMSADEAIYICMESCGIGRLEAMAKVERGKNNPERFDEEIKTIRVVHGENEAEYIISKLS